MMRSAVKDKPSSTPNWDLNPPTIEGVQIREVKNIPTGNGITVEAFREDWGLHDLQIRHIIAVTFEPNAVSAWHGHLKQTDHIFVIAGAMKGVLFDARKESPTYRKIDQLNLSALRPRLLVVPPGIMHGFKASSGGQTTFMNFFDVQYDYDDPDEYRLPPVNDEIPYRF